MSKYVKWILRQCFIGMSKFVLLDVRVMSKCSFLTPASFSIQAAAERTGLSPHVIRAWERRYRAITPERSAGKHRLYSETEIERLALLHRAVRSGHSIGKIASLSTDKLSALATNRSDWPMRGPNDSAALFRSDALVATKRFDGPALEAAFKRALLSLGQQGLVRQTIAPLAEEIGEQWRTGELSAAHEHFFTASVKVFLGNLTKQFAMPLNAPRVIVATPAGQLHELGAVMAASTAANLGWRSIYLGPSLPAHEIAGAALSNEAAAVALSIVYPEDDHNLPGRTNGAGPIASCRDTHSRRRPGRSLLHEHACRDQCPLCG